MTDMSRMNAQLVSPAGIGLHFEPGEILSDLIDDPIMGESVIGALLPMSGDAHAIAIGRLFLLQIGRDTAVVPLGTPFTIAQ